MADFLNPDGSILVHSGSSPVLSEQPAPGLTTPLGVRRTNGNPLSVLADIGMSGAGTNNLQGVIALRTMNTGTSNGTLVERMRVHTNGCVGIGTQSPTTALHVAGTVQVNQGDVIVHDGANRDVILLDGSAALLRIGAAGNTGYISVRDVNGREVFQFDATNAALRVGNTENDGDVIVRDTANREVIHLDGANAWLKVGTTGNEGDISVYDASNREVFRFDANYAALYIGAQGNEGDIIIRDDAGVEAIKLDGAAGKVILKNADVAEQFDVADAVDVAPGTVMALAADGTLVPACSPYDRKVVGVVAGGGAYRPGIVLDHRETAAGRRVPISVVGKVACRADARYGPVQVGDLLTSSPTAGHAMRAADPARAFGAVIGKALTPLEEGTGLIDMLISLQ